MKCITTKKTSAEGYANDVRWRVTPNPVVFFTFIICSLFYQHVAKVFVFILNKLVDNYMLFYSTI